MTLPRLSCAASLTLSFAVLALVACGPAESEPPPTDNRPPCPAGLVRNEQGLCHLATCEPMGAMALRTKTLGGTAATVFSVGDTMRIEGLWFGLGSVGDTVTFDGVPSTSLTQDPGEPARRWFSVIPPGIYDAPTQSNDAPKSGVCVQVQSAGSILGAASITVAPARATAVTIQRVSPERQIETGELTITGTGFSADAIVKIREISAQVVRRSATEIVVVVPDFPEILPGPPVSSLLAVLTPDGGNALAPKAVSVVGMTKLAAPDPRRVF